MLSCPSRWADVCRELDLSCCFQGFPFPFSPRAVPTGFLPETGMSCFRNLSIATLEWWHYGSKVEVEVHLGTITWNAFHYLQLVVFFLWVSQEEPMALFYFQRDVAHPTSLKSRRGWKWARWPPCSSIKVTVWFPQRSYWVGCCRTTDPQAWALVIWWCLLLWILGFLYNSWYRGLSPYPHSAGFLLSILVCAENGVLLQLFSSTNKNLDKSRVYSRFS